MITIKKDEPQTSNILRYPINGYMQIEPLAIEAHLNNLVTTYGFDYVVEQVTRQLGLIRPIVNLSEVG